MAILSRKTAPQSFRSRRYSRPRLEYLEHRLAPAGILDTTFTADGRVTTDFSNDDRATDVLIQPDGKIIVTGFEDGGSADFALARYLPDGTLDTTFSDDGRFTLTFNGADFATAAALQPDGKIVLVGYTDQGGGGGANNFAIARVNSNGTLDTSFSGDGKQIIDFGFDDRATGVVIQANGKIVVGGFDDGGAANFAVARLNTNGTLDTTFSDDGRFTNTFGGADFANAIALQEDGKIVLAGYTDQGGGGGASNFAAMRVNANGTLDSTFGASGEVITNFGFDDRATGVAIQRDGKIVVGGYYAGGNSEFAVARYNPDGTLDTSYNATSTPVTANGNGKLSFTFDSVDIANDVKIDADGNIVLLGSTSFNGDNFAVARVTPNGTLDTKFSGDGTFPVSFGGVDVGNALAIQPDGKIAVAGFTDQGGGGGANNFAVARIIGRNVQFLAIGGAPGRVEIFARDGTFLGSFSPYGGGYTGGISVALGDVNADGIDDLITGATIGNPHTKVYSGSHFQGGVFFANPEADVITQGFPYAVNFNVGSNVAAGDVNGDGFADIITGAAPGNPHVRVFDGKLSVAAGAIPTGTDSTVLAEGFAYGINFNIGANVGAGDVNGDGLADIVTGPTAGNPHTKVFDAQSILNTGLIPTELTSAVLAEFFPYAINFNVGAFVSVGDYNGDGFGDIITGSSVGNPEVRAFSGLDMRSGTFDPIGSELETSYAFELGANIGASVAAGDTDGDGFADVLTGSHGGATSRHRLFENNFPAPLSLDFEMVDFAFTGGVYVAE